MERHYSWNMGKHGFGGGPTGLIGNSDKNEAHRSCGVWLKPDFCFFLPSHLWDGNELARFIKQFYS
jgi:hypothetical protein